MMPRHAALETLAPATRRLLVVALAVAALCPSCSQTPGEQQPVARVSEKAEAAAATPFAAPRSAVWDAFVTEFIESYFQAHPPYAVMAGRHEFDGQLPDWSASGIAKEIARLHMMRARAAAYVGLNAQQEFEREYLISRIDRDLFWTEEAKWPFRCPTFYFDWMLDSLDPNVYVSRPYAPLTERLQAYTRYARSVPRAAAQIRANLRTPMPRTYVQRGVAAFSGLASYFENDVPLAFQDVKDEALLEAFKTANAVAVQAMADLGNWLKGHEAAATESFALGADLFAKMVRQTEGVDISLEKLEEVGRVDLERNLDALESACASFAPGLSVRDCIDKAAARKPEGGAVAGARRQLSGLREFLVRKDLVSIPGTEVALVEEAPPYNRWNFAYIDIPGPFEEGMPSVYYIAPPDPSWPAEEQAAYVPGEKDLLFTSAHEVWPGHFLNFLHANRSDFLFGRVFVGYAFAEGWAHYTEEMMWEAGLGDGDPETHIGQLLNALLRNVRFVSAIGLHAKGMSVEESERLFREKGYQDPGNARQQAARGTYDPAYLNYTLGKLIFRKLRADWTASRGGRAAWKKFHDAVLSYGGPPVPLVRRQMLGPDSGPAL